MPLSLIVFVRLSRRRAIDGLPLCYEALVQGVARKSSKVLAVLATPAAPSNPVHYILG